VRRSIPALIACILVLSGSTHAAATGSTSQSAYDATVSGKSCAEQTNQQTDCEYRVGRNLYFTITGVGQSYVGVTFLKVDFDGDYFASLGLLHGCVIVKPGRALPKVLDMAFVSPKNGNVYKTWQECQSGE
jgi:hypothetical protein